MKAIVFAYHDIGCVGLQALVDAGYDVQAVFTHTDSRMRTNSFLPLRVRVLNWICRFMRLKMLTIRCGSTASVLYSPILFSPSTTAIC